MITDVGFKFSRACSIVVEQFYARRVTAAEMKYMRRTAGYAWTDYKTNAQIAKS